MFDKGGKVFFLGGGGGGRGENGRWIATFSCLVELKSGRKQ